VLLNLCQDLIAYTDFPEAVSMTGPLYDLLHECTLEFITHKMHFFQCARTKVRIVHPFPKTRRVGKTDVVCDSDNGLVTVHRIGHALGLFGHCPGEDHTDNKNSVTQQQFDLVMRVCDTTGGDRGLRDHGNGSISDRSSRVDFRHFYLPRELNDIMIHSSQIPSVPVRVVGKRPVSSVVYRIEASRFPR
jgi:hypothetical protein